MTGKEIVAQWLMDLWIGRPDWLNRMPDRKDLDKLIANIDAAILSGPQKD